MVRKAIIVEDRQEARNFLKNLLREHCPQVKILAEAAEVEEAIERITLLRPDLVFMDIELGSGNAFDVLDQLRDFKGHLIFTTGHDDYALRAFRYHAIDYLQKPINPNHLRAAIDRLDGLEQAAQLRFELLRESVQTDSFKKIILTVAEEYRVVLVDDIKHLEGKGNYTLVFLASNESVMVSKPLQFFEETLPVKQFFRSHQSHLVNFNFVKKVLKGDDQGVLLKEGKVLPISRRKKDDFMEALFQWTGKSL